MLQHADALVGAPADVIVHQRKLKEKQCDKILGLVCSTVAPMHFLVWITITQLIMTLHYRLFKRGVFWNHMQAEEEADRRFAVFEFCRGPDSNPAGKLLTAVGQIMFDPDGAGRPHLRLLHARFGPTVAIWPLALMKELHMACVRTFSRSWRLLLHHFQQYPWRLAPIFDPDVEEEEQRRCAEAFIAIPKGSKQLDPGCGRKLRELVETAEDLFADPLYTFMSVLFERVVVTSTFVERLFKDLTNWTSRTPQGLATVAAKHVQHVFGKSVSRWRAGLRPCGKGVPASGLVARPRSRPHWVKPLNRGAKTTGYHLFQRGKSTEDLFNGVTLNAWASLEDGERESFNAQAERARILARVEPGPLDTHLNDVQSPELEAGPWNLSSQSGEFVIAPSCIERTMAGRSMSQVYRDWRARFDAKVLPDPAFPETVPFDGPLAMIAPEGAAAQGMLESIQLALRYADEGKDAGMLLEFRCGCASVYCLAAHSLHLERCEFEAELMVMELQHRIEPVDGEVEIPFVLKYRMDGDGLWPCAQSEKAFVKDLTQGSAELWTMHVLENTIIDTCKREVTRRTLLDVAELRQLDAVRLEQQAAMRLFKNATGGTGLRPCRKGRGGGRGRPVGSGGRPRCAGAEAKTTRKKCDESSAPSSSEFASEDGDEGGDGPKRSSSSSSSSSNDSMFKPKTKRKAKAKAKAAAAGSSGAASSSGPAAAASGPVPVPPRSKAGENVIELAGGKFPISRIESHGVLIGYGIVCGLHKNECGLHDKTPCKKTLTFGKGRCAPIPEEEAKKRLKRWLVSSHDLDPECERKSHVQLGGPQMKDFASDAGDPPWSDLDDVLEAMVDVL